MLGDWDKVCPGMVDVTPAGEAECGASPTAGFTKVGSAAWGPSTTSTQPAILVVWAVSGADSNVRRGSFMICWGLR